jgi:hypothetical protein
MKHLILITLSIGFILLLGCRKEEPAVLPTNGVFLLFHCSNGIMDADEDGIDCGPSCGPCLLSTATCGGVSQENNTFTPTTGASVNFASGTVVADTSTGVLVITGTVGTKYLKATFNTTTPDIFTSYPVVNTIPGQGQVAMQYYNGSTISTGYNNVMHLNRVNGKLSIEFCEVYFSIPFSFILGKGKLTEN